MKLQPGETYLIETADGRKGKGFITNANISGSVTHLRLRVNGPLEKP